MNRLCRGGACPWFGILPQCDRMIQVLPPKYGINLANNTPRNVWIEGLSVVRYGNTTCC
ncbi:hypothetical protein L208DRAFT_1419718, partial [Tricholoma matsutake]